MLALCSGLQSIAEWAQDPLNWSTILLVTAAVVCMCITGFDPIKEVKEIRAKKRAKLHEEHDAGPTSTSLHEQAREP